MGDKIHFEELKSRKVAVHKFHGKSAYSTMMKKIEDLKFWAKKTNLTIATSTRIVIYGSPIPFMRKNEIQLDTI